MKEEKMADLISKKNKHMILDDRIEIQDCLNHGMTFKAIAQRIGKDQTTVSKEVKKHLTVETSTVSWVNRSGTAENPICPSLLKAPFVCNPCKKRHTRCAFQKQLYHAKAAQSAYELLLCDAREGIPLNKDAFYEMDRVVSDGIKRGQHLYHIMKTNDLGVSQSTIYRHLHRGYLSVNKLDFPRVVKFKLRKAKAVESIPRAAKLGRTHEDFLSYIEKNGVSSWVEMDTVIGRVGGKALLTFDFTFCNFMAALLLEDKSAAQVTEKIRLLKNVFAAHGFRFGDVFPLLLTDNGGEFANVCAIENTLSGDERENFLFFCNPYQSSQKPKVEKNHTLFRDIVPTGKSFDDFSQETVNLIFSHINSVKRKSLYGKTPYAMFAFAYGEEIAAILGVTSIPADQVAQSPKLLKK
jgi:IS30 family transposase